MRGCSGPLPDPGVPRLTFGRVRGGPHILVVDDDESVRALVVAVLADDYDVETANDGAEGILRVIAEVPALVLLDLRMPRFGGRHLTTWLRAEGMKAPVVVMSGEIDGARTAAEMGAVAYLSKPFGLDELLATVHRFAPADRNGRPLAA